jgi:hypothetical protein
VDELLARFNSRELKQRFETEEKDGRFDAGD